MVRAKKTVPSQAQAETATMLERLKGQFTADIKELEDAKRRFSTRFVDEILSAIEAKVPEHVMAMPVREFARTLQESEHSERVCNDQQLIEKTPSNAVPTSKCTTFKSLKTPSGARVKIPSMITPRVDGAGMVRSRLSRRGEVLISLNGTPVLAENGDSAKQSAVINNEQTAIIQQLLQKEESELTPETRAIVGNLRAVLTKKLPPLGGGRGEMEGDEV